MLALTWLVGCTLAALLGGLTWGDGAWVPGVAALIAAQAAVLAGSAGRLPSWATWPAALACAAAGALGHRGTDLVVYVVALATLLLVASRFARLSAFRTTTLADPVAREFARARRDESHLAVASIAVPEARGAARRLGRIARELVASLRRTDAIVRSITDRLVVVLPGGDSALATTVLKRVLVDEHNEVLVGTATFPEDGLTWESLKDVAQAREQPWPCAGAAGIGSRTDRVTQHVTGHDPRAHGAESAP